MIKVNLRDIEREAARATGASPAKNTYSAVMLIILGCCIDALAAIGWYFNAVCSIRFLTMILNFGDDTPFYLWILQGLITVVEIFSIPLIFNEDPDVQADFEFLKWLWLILVFFDVSTTVLGALDWLNALPVFKDNLLKLDGFVLILLQVAKYVIAIVAGFIVAFLSEPAFRQGVKIIKLGIGFLHVKPARFD